MYPPVIQFETRQMELEAALGLYELTEALAQRQLATTCNRADRFQAAGPAARLRALLGRRTALDPKPGELRRIPLFASLPPQRFDLLVRTADPIDVPAGKVLIREGDNRPRIFRNRRRRGRDLERRPLDHRAGRRRLRRVRLAIRRAANGNSNDDHHLPPLCLARKGIPKRPNARLRLKSPRRGGPAGKSQLAGDGSAAFAGGLAGV
jgi:hypothetical protein